jgi:hypothetical protein
MKTTILPEHPDAKSPAGADIRFVMACEAGNMIHSTVPPQQVNRATMHATVSELWFVLEGRGEIWRIDGDESCVTALVPGVGRHTRRDGVSVPKHRGRGPHVHLRLHAALAGRLEGDVRRREVAAHDLTGRQDGFPRAYARVRESSGMTPERVESRQGRDERGLLPPNHAVLIGTQPMSAYGCESWWVIRAARIVQSVWVRFTPRTRATVLPQ